jgi:lipopolysaccharide transport system ATP-binding protein
MSNVVIQVDSLSKEYNRMRPDVSGLLRDVIVRTLKSPLSIFRRERQEKFWALQDINLEVKNGEVVALIGRNGSGKTTLLKILSRITQPTKGWGEIHGRVGSLLEVGTGFHPELSGRENTYLSGAILGMSKQEITRKFDEIVAFAELEKFIDTPVKHYSSGMYVRLAFAVAAHLEPEILLVDEVLAVGDANFQEKCMGKMSDVSRQGRTILFVSHNMGAVAQLCTRAVILDKGTVQGDSDPQSAIAQYLRTVGRSGNTADLSASFNPSAAAVTTRLWLEDENGNALSSVDVRKPFQVGIEFVARQPLRGMDVAFRIDNSLQQPIFTSCMFDRIPEAEFAPGSHIVRATVPGHFLAPDTYFVTPILHRPNVEIVDIHERVLTFRVEESGSNMWQYAGSRYGCVLVSLDWDRREGTN